MHFWDVYKKKKVGVAQVNKCEAFHLTLDRNFVRTVRAQNILAGLQTAVDSLLQQLDLSGRLTMVIRYFVAFHLPLHLTVANRQ